MRTMAKESEMIEQQMEDRYKTMAEKNTKKMLPLTVTEEIERAKSSV